VQRPSSIARIPSEKAVDPARTAATATARGGPTSPTLQPSNSLHLAENPFADQASINTASDRATNVIPIAYVPPSSSSALTSITDATNFTSNDAFVR
jgi:hypothetical protein